METWLEQTYYLNMFYKPLIIPLQNLNGVYKSHHTFSLSVSQSLWSGLLPQFQMD